MMMNSAALVTGASGAIGLSVLRHFADHFDDVVHGLSRSAAPAELPSGVQWHQCDYSDNALHEVAGALKHAGATLERLVITNGLLHDGPLQPERALRQIEVASMERVFAVNAFLPMQILAAMTPLLRQADAPRIVALSARVGSLADNGLGGWYSYRGSKAALNMMMKCAAIEFRRLNRQAKLMVFHPGTTDSALSAPFQSRVPPEKLFTPEFVAERLWAVLDASTADGELAYVDWAGKPIPW
jgi:NAD(P)-dependent dehydrogenase (short-subunit alcohol dehydrogenase family)